MRGKHLTTIATALLMLALPLASAEWGGRGFYEPDTARDTADGYMYDAPDTNVGGRQVYFSIFSNQFIAGGNPNLATTKGGFMAYPTSIHAFLGVWKDCNADGYIGTEEGALLDYRSELLLDTSICPPTPGHPDDAGFVPSHNDGQWVQEFLWIGPDDPTRCTGEGTPEQEPVNDDPYNLVDDCARVWADFGFPEDAGGDSCPINPRPRGTYQSVGGFLRFADCLNSYRTVGAINTVAHASGQHGLAFDDADQRRPDQSNSPLNAKNPYGQPSADPTVSVWDCSGSGSSVSDPTGGGMRRVGVDDPTGLVPDEMADPRGGAQDPIRFKNEDGSLVAVNFTEDDGSLLRVHDVRTPNVNPDGSPAGAVNETLEGTPNVGFTSVQAPALGLIFTTDEPSVEGDDGDCDREEGIGENSDVYDIDEDDFEATGAKRVQTDFYMNFRENAPRGESDANDPLGPSQPAVLGLGSRAEGVLNSPLWFGQPGYVGSRNPYVNRDSLEPWGSVVVTAYAKVSTEALSVLDLSLPNGGVFSTYGAPHCVGAAPTTGAFECDASKWWLGPQGEDIKTVWQVTVGEQYNLRDIDCWDQSPAAAVPSPFSAFANSFCVR